MSRSDCQRSGNGSQTSRSDCQMSGSGRQMSDNGCQTSHNDCQRPGSGFVMCGSACSTSLKGLFIWGRVCARTLQWTGRCREAGRIRGGSGEASLSPCRGGFSLPETPNPPPAPARNPSFNTASRRRFRAQRGMAALRVVRCWLRSSPYKADASGGRLRLPGEEGASGCRVNWVTAWCREKVRFWV